MSSNDKHISEEEESTKAHSLNSSESREPSNQFTVLFTAITKVQR